jgi:hypothetical protein
LLHAGYALAFSSVPVKTQFAPVASRHQGVRLSGGRQAAAWPGRVGALFCPGLAGQNNNTRREALLLFFLRATALRAFPSPAGRAGCGLQRPLREGFTVIKGEIYGRNQQNRANVGRDLRSLKGGIYGISGEVNKPPKVCYSVVFAHGGTMKGKALVVKSNRLIEAGYRLTLVEQRIILMAIVEARRTQRGINGEDFVRITAKSYAQQFDVDESNAYLQMNDARKSLFNRQFVTYQPDEETGYKEVIEARWLSAASYIDGAGAIRLQFSPAVVPYITRLETEFTRYKLEKIAKMTSTYAIRLYELLIQWGSIGKREIDLQWLRKILKLENEYQSIKDFKKWVIDVALSQINEHSDLTASYTQRKTGRNVTHLIFTFSVKEETQPEPAAAQEAAPAVPDSPLLQRLRNLGIGAKLAAAWLKQDEARARAAAAYVEARAQNGQIKGSAAGYLRSVFESGAEIGPSDFEAAIKEQARVAAASARRAEAEQRAKEKAERAALDRAKEAMQALAPETRLSLAAEYRQGDGAAWSGSWDAKKGEFRDAIESIQFKVWLQKKIVRPAQA